MEQSYKEKYEDILARLERAKNDNDVCDDRFCCVIDEIIPELAESEDEKIRKEIIDYIKTGTYHKSWIAWLEKQGQVKESTISQHENRTCEENDDSLTSEDERIRKWCISHFKGCINVIKDNDEYKEYLSNKVLAWLERQGEHANFRNKIQVGDKVTRNEDGVLVNLSQLNRVAKKNEKQCEQKPIEMKSAEESLGIDSDTYNKIVDECIFGEKKPTDKVEPKFKVGDFIANDYCFGKVIALTDDAYLLDSEQGIPFSCEHNTHLWTIADAKDGDVLADYAGVILFRKIGNERYADVVDYYCVVNTNGRFEIQEKFDYWGEANDAQLHPATKEQRDTLLKAMADAGYTFDFERKKLKKIEPKTKENKGNIGGISPNWSEEDKDFMYDTLSNLTELKDRYGEGYGNVGRCIDWLKSLKDKVQPQNKWKPSDE